MTTTYEADDNVLFGPETDDEDEQNKMDHEVDDVDDEEDESVEDERARPAKRPRSEMNKNKILKKMLESARKTGKQVEARFHNGQKSWCEKQEPLAPRAPPKKKITLPNRMEHCTEAILVNDDDLDKREKRADECKIKREVGVRETRFYPFYVGACSNTQEFYSKRTDLACMWCTEPFDCVPIAKPHSYSNSKGAFYVGGQFCSFQCLLADAKVRGKRPLACHMMKSVYGVSFGEIMQIRDAPSPFLLEKFGGVMSIKAYRGTCKLKKSKIKMLALPFIPFYAGMEEVTSMKTTIYEYGNEERVRRVVNASIVMSQPVPISNHKSTGLSMQRTKLAQMPTLKQQIAQAENTLRLERSAAAKAKGKGKKTLMDFMKIK